MATELAMAMRRLKAQEEQARLLTELNRKMDLVMAKLGIVDEVPVAAAVVEPKADELHPAEASEVKADEVPAAEAKSKKK
jgi:hypothetical protein